MIMSCLLRLDSNWLPRFEMIDEPIYQNEKSSIINACTEVSINMSEVGKASDHRVNLFTQVSRYVYNLTIMVVYGLSHTRISITKHYRFVWPSINNLCWWTRNSLHLNHSKFLRHNHTIVILSFHQKQDLA